MHRVGLRLQVRAVRARLALFTVGAVGIVAAVVVALQGHMDAGSTAGLLGWTIGGAAVTAVVAAGACSGYCVDGRRRCR